jgi:hypothetical protein
MEGSGPDDNERKCIEEGCQEDAPKRDAEKIPLGEKDVAEQQYQAKREKKDGPEQEVAVCQGQVAYTAPNNLSGSDLFLFPVRAPFSPTVKC